METETNCKRRSISDEEFRVAYYGEPGNPESQKKAADNRGIIRSVVRRYEQLVPLDTLSSCAMTALWRCLQYYQGCYGQKFTTSLHRFVEWECRRELKKVLNRRKRMGGDQISLADAKVDPACSQAECTDDIEHLKTYMGRLPTDFRQVIEQYYFKEMTLEQMGQANGYSKESARQRIGQAVAKLRHLCVSS